MKTWVEIEKIILAPDERAANIPDDTRATPLKMRVSGFLDEKNKNAKPGDTVSITTLIGRKIEGNLFRFNPSYDHSFGQTIDELLTIGKEEYLK